MASEGEEGRQPRKGPSNFTISISGVVGFFTLFFSGVTYVTEIKTDLAGLKKNEVYQEKTNEQLREGIKAAQTEHRETLKEFNEKSDRILGILSAMERENKK